MSNMKILRLVDIKLKGGVGASLMAKFLANMPLLQELDISNNVIEANGFSILCRDGNFGEKPKLEKLGMDGIGLKYKSLKDIKGMLGKLK